jgi:hypothetical protein
MHIFTDESGHFVESENSEWGIIVMVSISDSALKDFEDFIIKLMPDDYHSFKASNLDFKIREKILKYIGSRHEIKYSAFVYDYKSTSMDAATKHRSGQIQKIEKTIDSAVNNKANPSMISEVKLIRNQLNKMSISDYIKTILVTESYKEWSRTFLFDFLYIDKLRDSWKLHHILDMQNKPERFVKVVYSLLYLTTNNLAGNKFRVHVPSELANDHPLITNYETSEGINMKEVMMSRRCGDDKKDIGLKLPDIISNTLFKSICNRNEIKWLRALKRVKSNVSITHKRGRNQRVAYYTILSLMADLSTGPSDSIREHWDAMKAV